jgi:hypothetical protein
MLINIVLNGLIKEPGFRGGMDHIVLEKEILIKQATTSSFQAPKRRTPLL